MWTVVAFSRWSDYRKLHDSTAITTFTAPTFGADHRPVARVGGHDLADTYLASFIGDPIVLVVRGCPPVCAIIRVVSVLVVTPIVVGMIDGLPFACFPRSLGTFAFTRRGRPGVRENAPVSEPAGAVLEE